MQKLRDLKHSQIYSVREATAIKIFTRIFNEFN